MRFRLMAGMHQETDGTVYSAVGKKKGPIITSDRELDKIFGAEKFKRVGEIVDEGDVKDDDQNDNPAKGDRDDSLGKDGGDADLDDSPAEGHDSGAPAPLGDDDRQDADAAEDKPLTTLLAIHRSGKMWDVYKVVNGMITEEKINRRGLSKKKALELAEKGPQTE